MSRGPLLDTHAWVWWVHGDERLGREALRALDDLGPNERPAICDISLWEVATLVTRGRLHLDMPFAHWLGLAAHSKTVRILPISRRVALELNHLGDAIPRDPADRLIIATSRAENRPLLTRDDVIRRSGLVKLWMPGPLARDLSALLPRLLELRDLTPDPSHPDAYFTDFESKLQSDHVFGIYKRLEGYLAALEPAAWHDLRARARATLIARQRTTGRGWQDLFDVLNEAIAYAYLKAVGATAIRFLSPQAVRTPDLSATLAGQRVLCEVKTLNKSEAQAVRDRRTAEGHVQVTKAALTLPPQWIQKFVDKVTDALDQLREHDTGDSKLIVFVAINFDDRIGDHDDRHFAQIDDLLDSIDLSGAELVLFPTTNAFRRKYVMRNATVFLG